MTKPGLESDRARLWRDPHLDGMELLHARYVTHAFAPHAHETFAIGVVLAGALSFSYRKEREIISSGEVMVINPHEMHTGQAVGAQGCTYRMLYPSATALQEIAVALAARSRSALFFPASRIVDESLAQLVLRLHLALEDTGTPCLERETRLLGMLTELVRFHAEIGATVDRSGPRGAAWIPQAVDYLETHFADDVSLQQMAAALNVSPFHLLRTFRAEVGAPPHAFLTQIRIRHAKQLLSRGLPIVQIAADTGFSDQSHLTRCFRQAVGITPGQYQCSCLVG